MNVVRLLLTFTFAFVDLSNLFHCPLFDGSCSPILQVFNYLHHVLCSNGFICKLVNMIVPLFMKEICKICKVVIPAFSGHKFFEEVGDCGILRILVVITWRPTKSLISDVIGRGIRASGRRIWGLP